MFSSPRNDQSDSSVPDNELPSSDLNNALCSRIRSYCSAAYKELKELSLLILEGIVPCSGPDAIRLDRICVRAAEHTHRGTYSLESVVIEAMLGGIVPFNKNMGYPFRLLQSTDQW